MFTVLWFIFCGFLWPQSQATSARAGTGIFRLSNLRQCHNGVAYPGLGCFTRSPPFTNTGWLPQSPSAIGLSFLLYTRDNPSTPDAISATNRSSIHASNFDAQFPVKFIIHGFLQFASMDYIANMTSALLNKAPMNVIVVSWGDGAGFPYSRAVANTRVVGAALAQLIVALNQVTVISARRIHIIGHSLGAHIAGYAGALIPSLGRITGLDPAQPSFSGYPRSVRLDASDARFVDVIHSDAVPYDTVGGYGIREAIGHVDFYPNGGHHQPGCHDDTSVFDFLEDAVRNGITIAEGSLSCSHERSTELFTWSVILSSAQNSCTFQAFPCQSEGSYMRGECLSCGNRPCPTMGLEADVFLRSRGVFYLNTTGSQPFCGHHYFVALTLTSNMTYTEGLVSVRLRGASGAELTWRSIKEGGMNGGDKLTTMIVDAIDIGEINEVEIKFQYNSDSLDWRANSLYLQKVEVDNVMRFPKKYFCRPSMDVQSGQVVTLTSGTYEPSECP